MAVESMRKAYARDEFREMMEFREKAERDEKSRLHHAERKGRVEGRLELLRSLVEAGMSHEDLKQKAGATDSELKAL